MSLLVFPRETYFKTNYIVYRVTLDVKPKLLNIIGDYISVVRILTTADLNKVYIGFNQEPSIPLIEISSGVITPFHQLFLTWEDSENGKVVTFLIGQEARFTTAKQGVLILNELTLSQLIRWGRYVSPVWIDGTEVTAPTANTKLVSKVVGGNEGYIYGFYLAVDEANDFLISWVSGGVSKTLKVKIMGAGSLEVIDNIPLNEGSPADKGSEISITNVNAGSAGAKYYARLLYAET